MSPITPGGKGIKLGPNQRSCVLLELLSLLYGIKPQSIKILFSKQKKSTSSIDDTVDFIRSRQTSKPLSTK